MRIRGVNDFTQYRCDPNVEPPRMTHLPKDTYEGAGLPKERAKSKL